MNPAIERLREQNEKKAEQETKALMHQQQVQAIQSLEQTTATAFSAFMQYLEGRVSKTEVVNQLESIGTPDAFKVMSAVNDMHSTLKKLKNTDLTPVTQIMAQVLAQVEQLPKELPEQSTEIKVTNLTELADKFDSLEYAVNALAEKELPTPQVKVDAPVVNVPETQVNVEAPDFTTLQKGIKDVVTAIKNQVFPELTVDLSETEKQLKEANKTLKQIADKPMGGGSSGGHGTPYQDSTAKPVYVELQDGSIPTFTAPTMERYDYDDATTIYVGTALIGTGASSTGWTITKYDLTDPNNASALIATDVSWSNRTSGSYS